MNIVKKPIIGENQCGLILKPFDEEWTLKPSYGHWWIFPLTTCNRVDSQFLYSLNTTQPQVTISQTAVNGKALMIYVRNVTWEPDNLVHQSWDVIDINRQDLYIQKIGISIKSDMSFLYRNTAINTRYLINCPFNECNIEFPRWFVNSGYGKYDISEEQSSGIKTGQFIL